MEHSVSLSRSAILARAWRDTRVIFGWNGKGLGVLALLAIALLVYWQWQGVGSAGHEIAPFIGFSIAPVGAIALLLLGWNGVMALYRLERERSQGYYRLKLDLQHENEALVHSPSMLEERLKPRLSIVGVDRTGNGRVGYYRGIVIRNEGLGEADMCRGQLEEISCLSDGVVSSLPVPRNLQWSLGNSMMPTESLSISGSQSAVLDVAYLEPIRLGDRSEHITWKGRDPAETVGWIPRLFYAGGVDFRRSHSLPRHQQLLLLISVTSGSYAPGYAVCRLRSGARPGSFDLELVDIARERPTLAKCRRSELVGEDSGLQGI